MRLPSYSRQKPRHRGIALIVVLASILILSAIISQMTYESAIVGTATRNILERTQAMQLAKGGVMISLLRLKLAELATQMIPGMPKADALNQQIWTMPFIFPPPKEFVVAMMKGKETPPEKLADTLSTIDINGTIYTQIEDERGKINLNMLKDSKPLQEQLLTLFTARKEFRELFRLRRLDPKELISNIIDWIDEDDVRTINSQREEEAYRNMNVKYPVKNGPIESMDELRMIAGFDDQLIMTFSPFLTVYVQGYDPKININTAPAEVLNTFWKEDLDASRVSWTKELLAQRNKMTFSDAQDSRFEDVMSKLGVQQTSYYSMNATYQSDTFKIMSQATVNTTTVSVEAVVRRQNGFLITYWRTY